MVSGTYILDPRNPCTFHEYKTGGTDGGKSTHSKRATLTYYFGPFAPKSLDS